MTVTVSHTLTFGGEVVSFSIERTVRRKTVAVSVGYDGVRVLAPQDLDDDRIIGIVRKKGAWILRKQASFRELGGTPVVREFVSGETFYYLGRPYRLKVVPVKVSVGTRIIARGLWLIARVPSDTGGSARRAAVRSALRRWYCQHARHHFEARAKAMAALLGISMPPVYVVSQSKRWGSCDARARIRLNWRLIMAPVSLIDYVIAHEACHVLEHNHSRRFWRSLEVVMPDYMSRVRKLDRLGHLFVC